MIPIAAFISIDAGTASSSHRNPGPYLLEGKFHIGHIALVCALDWLEFRQIVPLWSADRPRLLEWYRSVAGKPSLAATRPG